MNLSMVKNNIESHLGDSISIKCNLGRNKYENYKGKIIKIYKNIFLVEDKNKDIKSFSYNDVIMKTIKIDYL